MLKDESYLFDTKEARAIEPLFDSLVSSASYVSWARHPVTDYDEYHRDGVRVPAYEIALPDGRAPYTIKLSHFASILKLDPMELPRYVVSSNAEIGSAPGSWFPLALTTPFAVALLRDHNSSLS